MKAKNSYKVFNAKKNLKVCIYTKTKEKKVIHDLKENASRIAGDFASHLFYYIQDTRCYS